MKAAATANSLLVYAEDVVTPRPVLLVDQDPDARIILRRVLEDSGLRRDRDYRLQVSIDGLSGDDQRPDAVIYLPEQRQLV